MRNGKILRVWWERRIDENPDTSYLGEYSDKPSTEWAIDRKERGDQGHNEKRYWNPAQHCPPGRAESWAHVTASCIRLALTANGLKACDDRAAAIMALDLHYIEQNYAQMESLNRGDWCYIGLIAKAEVQLDRNGLVQTIHSGGLWGIESDSDNAYLNQVRSEELTQLGEELARMGFSKGQIERAFANVEED